ncbi:MAG: PKD domain-containing protein [Gemmatimonadetes bacterium]|nr:PKD domain-containing protein [Gemmatimonadota bacterium]
MHFDGSDVGFGDDMDAVHLLPNGDLLFSPKTLDSIPGYGAVDENDIVRFSGTFGENTSGTVSPYLIGNNVGLVGEDIDAIGFAPDGRLVISLTGSFAVPGVSGKDEDLIALESGTTWAMYLDGSDVGLSDTSEEDVAGVWLDPDAGDIYLTTAGPFDVPGVSGDPSDIFVCSPQSLGETSSCTFSSYIVGSLIGLAGNEITGFHIQRGATTPNVAPTADFTHVVTDLQADFTDASTDSDGTIVGWLWNFGDSSPTSTTQNPSHSYTTAGTYSVTLTVTDDDGATGAVTLPVTVTSTSTGELIYLSPTSTVTLGGIQVKDEDLVTYDVSSGAWARYFDGSDIGFGDDMDVVHLLPNGDLLFSTKALNWIPGYGPVDENDIVRFSGNFGENTFGTVSPYLIGDNVGLAGEDIDAIGFAPDGRLVISLTGSFSVPGLSGKDEDLIVLETDGTTWSMYLDGSDVGLSDTSDEDVAGIWLDPDNGDIYLTTVGPFDVPGVSGDAAHIFVCSPRSLGETSACTFSPYIAPAPTGLGGTPITGFYVQRR